MSQAGTMPSPLPAEGGAGRQGLGMSRSLRLRFPCLRLGREVEVVLAEAGDGKAAGLDKHAVAEEKGSVERAPVRALGLFQTEPAEAVLVACREIPAEAARPRLVQLEQAVRVLRAHVRHVFFHEAFKLPFPRRWLSSLLMMDTTQGMTTRWMRVRTSLDVGPSLPAASNASARGFSSSTRRSFFAATSAAVQGISSKSCAARTLARHVPRDGGRQVGKAARADAWLRGSGRARCAVRKDEKIAGDEKIPGDEKTSRTSMGGSLLLG